MTNVLDQLATITQRCLIMEAEILYSAPNSQKVIKPDIKSSSDSSDDERHAQYQSSSRSIQQSEILKTTYINELEPENSHFELGKLFEEN